MCYKKLIWRSERCKACGWVIACPNPTYPKRSPKNSRAIRTKNKIKYPGLEKVCVEKKKIKKNISASHVVFEGRLISW